jgi:hypothetical protein
LTFVCKVCGKAHDGFPALTCRAPAMWDAASKLEQKRDFKLSDDFCVYKDEHFFIRCVLLVPVIDADVAPLEFGVWSTLSKDNFRRYAETFDDGDQSKIGGMFGWFSNWVDGYPDTTNLPCDVWPQDNGQRPLIELHDSDHPLVEQQRQGITLDHLTRFMHERGYG